MVSAAFFQEHCSYLSEQKKTSMIQEFADRLVYGLLGLSADTPIGIAVNFFFYPFVLHQRIDGNYQRLLPN